MKPHRLASLALCATSALALSSGCAADSDRPAGPAVEIAVAPLSLPNTLGVEYALAVFNDDPADYAQVFDGAGAVLSGNDPILVWQQASVTSNQFGNGPGGDISYVGPCDASADDNWVALALKRVDVGDTNGSWDAQSGAFAGGDRNLLDDQVSTSDDDADFENPCPYDDPCILPFPCEENEDTRVVFNLTIMRDAEQGFFDVAVNFEDIFCSAKVDCAYDDAGTDPIELLFDADGKRAQTAVFGLACTQGAGATGTVLHMNGVRVECGEDLGTAIDATAYVSACATDGGLFGAVTGSTEGAQALTLPVAWKDGAAAVALPTGTDYAAGLVFTQIDADTLVGVVADAGAIDASNGRGITLKVDTLALWKRPDADSAWSLGATYELPDGLVVTSLADMSYDAITQRVWLNASEDELARPVYFQKESGSQSLTSGVKLSTPEGFPYCSLRHAKGELAVGQCTANMQKAEAREAQKDGTPTEPTVAVVWAFGADNSVSLTTLPIAGVFTDVDWTAVQVNIVEPARIVGTLYDDEGNYAALDWRFFNGKWEQAPLLGDNLRVEWIADHVIALASKDGQESVRTWNGTSWSTWANTDFSLPFGYKDAVALGYSAQHGLLYGLMMHDTSETLQLWTEALPASDQEQIKPELRTSDINVTYAVLGEVTTANAWTLLLLAKDASFGERRIAARFASDTWSFNEASAFWSGPGIEPKSFMTSAEPVQGCEAVIGTSRAESSKIDEAATWNLDGSGAAITPKTYLNPAAFLAVGEQVGSYQAYELDPTIVGNAWDPPNDDKAVWQYAIYAGAEDLDCDGVSCQKVYWNTAVGFDPSVAGCRLVAEATAAASPGLTDGTTPEFTTWPLISVDAPLTSTPKSAEEDVELLCLRHPLGSSQVQTIYTDVHTPQTLCHRFDGTIATSLADCEWTPYADRVKESGAIATPIRQLPRN